MDYSFTCVIDQSGEEYNSPDHRPRQFYDACNICAARIERKTCSCKSLIPYRHLIQIYVNRNKLTAL